MIDTQNVDAAKSEASAPPTHYRIDPDWFERSGLSFKDVVQSRMCEPCRSRIGEDREERVPVFDKATGKMQMETRRTTYGSDPVAAIKEHCGRTKNYITHDLPTLEAIFRAFLANGNQPMTMEQVRDQLTEWCPGGGCQWLLLPLEMVERLVKNDRYYGLAPAQAE